MQERVSSEVDEFLRATASKQSVEFSDAQNELLCVALRDYREEYKLSYEAISNAVLELPHSRFLNDHQRKNLIARHKYYLTEINRNRHEERVLIQGKTVERFIKSGEAVKPTIAAIRDFLVVLGRISPYALDPTREKLAPAFALRNSFGSTTRGADSLKPLTGEVFGVFARAHDGQCYFQARFFAIEPHIYTFEQTVVRLKKSPVDRLEAPQKKDYLKYRKKIFWAVSFVNFVYGQIIESKGRHSEVFSLYSTVGRFKKLPLTKSFVILKHKN